MSTDQPKESYFALNVALSTLSERCQQLQARLTALEEENLELRARCVDSNFPPIDPNIEHQTELAMLREKNNELTRQKQQLSEHITMVATENRQLWSRLSKLTKNNEQLENMDNKLEPSSPTNTHQNLIRSKTFTQNDPNPKLREKFNKDEEPEDLLVDVAKFAISENNGQNGVEVADMNHVIDDLVSLKEEVMQQQRALKTAFEKLKNKKPIAICSSCANSKSKMKDADAEIETKPVPKGETIETSKFVDIVLNTTNNIDFLETKRKADALNSNDRICPMCGRTYSKNAVFEEFMEHVESHFIEDDVSSEDDKDMSIEPNFEIVSQTVGNF